MCCCDCVPWIFGQAQLNLDLENSSKKNSGAKSITLLETVILISHQAYLSIPI